MLKHNFSVGNAHQTEEACIALVEAGKSKFQIKQGIIVMYVSGKLLQNEGNSMCSYH